MAYNIQVVMKEIRRFIICYLFINARDDERFGKLDEKEKHNNEDVSLYRILSTHPTLFIVKISYKYVIV